MLLVHFGGLELVSAKDAAGWTFLHRLVYGSDDALACEIASVSQGEALVGHGSPGQNVGLPMQQ
jgi:hypothetical protein